MAQYGRANVREMERSHNPRAHFVQNQLTSLYHLFTARPRDGPLTNQESQAVRGTYECVFQEGVWWSLYGL